MFVEFGLGISAITSSISTAGNSSSAYGNQQKIIQLSAKRTSGYECCQGEGLNMKRTKNS